MYASNCVVCLLAGAVLLFGAPYQKSDAQSAAHPEIRGVVLEPGTNQPVVEAEVTLEYFGSQQPRMMPSPPKSSTATKTDASGTFVFHPPSTGYFYLRVSKAGYSEMHGMPPSPSSEQSVTLTDAQPLREVRLALSRPGQIAGVVVDSDTRKPLADVRLQAWSVRQRLRMPLPAGKTAISKANGEFTFSELAGGDYIVEIMPKRSREDRVIAKFSESDLKTVEQDFEHTYWPGGHGLEAALPVTVTGGATIDIGALPLRKTGWYRVHIRFPGVDCKPGDKVGVREFQRVLDGGQLLGLGQTACRGDLLVVGFPPGAYRLILGLTRADGDPESSSIPFSIKDENLEILAGFERPVTVEGAFVPADGSRLPDLSTVAVSWETGGGKLNTQTGPVKPDAKGKFEIPTFLSEGRRLQMYRLNPGVYVKEIRYNGAPVKGDFVPLDKGAMSQSLSIVLDDRPAAISGAVLKGGKPAGAAVVILAKWPPPEEGALPGSDYVYAKTDDNGRFQLGGLAPGEYRAIAATIDSMMTDPPLETIRRALAGSSKVELGRSAFQSLTLEVSELR